MEIRSAADVRSRLQELRDRGDLREATLKSTFEAANAASVRIAPEELAGLYETFAASVFVDEASRARSFLDAAMPALAGLAPSGARSEAQAGALGRVALQLLAGADRRLQRNEIADAIETLRAYFARSGLAPEAAARKARITILGELGARAGGGTVHQVDAAGNISALAKGFGDPLAVHTKNYGAFIADKAFRETRAMLVRWQKDSDSVLSTALEKAPSFADLAELLTKAGELPAAAAHLAKETEAPLADAFAGMVGRGAGEIAERWRKLDAIRVVVTDAERDGKLGPGDLIGIDMGGVVRLSPVDPVLSDKLLVSQAMKLAVRDMTDAAGASKFEFHRFPPKVNPAFFEVDPSEVSFHLRPDKKASAAIEDIIANPQLYKFECATAIVLCWHIAQYRLFAQKYGEVEGKKRFDQLFANMEIGVWEHGDEISFTRKVVSPESDVAMAGEWRYFKAWDVDHAGRWRGWRGENVIYIGKADRNTKRYKKGDDLYFGHPFGVTSGKHIMESLDEHRFNVRFFARGGVAELCARIASRLEELKGERGGGKRDEVEKEIRDLTKRNKGLAAIIARLDDSAEARASLAKYIHENQDKLEDADNAVVDARTKHGKGSREEKRAQQEYARLAGPIEQRDEATDALDSKTWSMAQKRLGEILRELGALKRDPALTSSSPQLALLKAEYDALRALEPRAASLTENGIELRPSVPKR